MYAYINYVFNIFKKKKPPPHCSALGTGSSAATAVPLGQRIPRHPLAVKWHSPYPAHPRAAG